MSLTYKILYRLGITPWEQMANLPVTDQISWLFEREEAGREPPYGQALDLGCGSGIWSVKLAARGWQVTGVDIVEKALRSARERARQAGVWAKFVRGDVTNLGTSGVGAGYRFFLDFGCFHELSDAQRLAMGREVSALAADGATLLMQVFTPARRGPMLPRGAGAEGIQGAYPEWKIIDEDAANVTGAPAAVQKAEPRFYRLRHE